MKEKFLTGGQGISQMSLVRYLSQYGLRYPSSKFHCQCFSLFRRILRSLTHMILGWPCCELRRLHRQDICFAKLEPTYQCYILSRSSCCRVFLPYAAAELLAQLHDVQLLSLEALISRDPPLDLPALLPYGNSPLRS